MIYQVIYKIANPNDGDALDYTDSNLENVFSSTENSIEEEGRLAFEYLKASMPGQTEIHLITEDILKYYKEVFDLDSSAAEQLQNLTITFYMHSRFIGSEGNSIGDKIEICCKSIVKNMWVKPDLAYFLDNATYEKSECFKNNLRRVLAHELYHCFHSKSCKNAKLSNEDSYMKIIKEIFANYFAYAYLTKFLEDTEKSYIIDGKGNKVDNPMFYLKRNHVANWFYEAKLFGIGRKGILTDYYSKEEQEADLEAYNKLNSSDRKFTNPGSNGVSFAEYAAGYILFRYGEKFENGNQGRNMNLYKSMFNDYLCNKADEALYDIMQAKDKVFTI